MNLSVITVCYNSAATVVDTVESVLAQSHPQVEYLIIDGGSKDETLSKLTPYRERIAVLVSEPDGGMYDAMNKGIARASGDVIAILNSDDVYAHKDILSRVGALFASSGADCVYGDLDYVAASDTNRVVREWRSGPYQTNSFRRGWHPPHPAFFVRKSIYEKLGGFVTDLRIAADFEFMLRVLERNHTSVAYLPEVIVKMRTGGESNRSLHNMLQANRECYRAWRMNGYSHFTAATAVLRKPLGKLKQLRR
jgi:glycosyltransferase involved in cell wall biosynthesis